METSTPEDILAAAEVHKESQVIEEQDVVGEEDQAEESVREAKPNEAEDITLGRVVDVVLSDMSAPWPLVNSTWIKSINTPYLRMMNTSGIAFRDHAGSMVSHAPIVDDLMICWIRDYDPDADTCPGPLHRRTRLLLLKPCH
jgi:23S rRNA U2552 (ribose-2'-O)-methylase RlmE/FtsJ